MEARKIVDAADARRCLAAVATSGRPRAAWAREHGVDARSLNAWRITLERRAVRGPQLVELVATTPALAPTTTYRVRCGPFEVELTDDFDDGSLGRLLRVVAAC